MRGGHVSWKNSKGILLMGGLRNLFKPDPDLDVEILSSTTLLQPGGSYKDDFTLVEPNSVSCAIEDPKTSSIINTVFLNMLQIEM